MEEEERVDEGMELVGKVSSVHIRDGDGYYRYSGSCAVRTHSLQPTTLTKDTLLVISYSNRAPYSEFMYYVFFSLCFTVCSIFPFINHN